MNTQTPFGRIVRVALLAGWFGLSGNAAWGAVLLVKPGQSIAAAIRAAQPSDTVQVARGVYAEHLLIDKPITLQGLDRPTISGKPAATLSGCALPT